MEPSRREAVGVRLAGGRSESRIECVLRVLVERVPDAQRKPTVRTPRRLPDTLRRRGNADRLHVDVAEAVVVEVDLHAPLRNVWLYHLSGGTAVGCVPGRGKG